MFVEKKREARLFRKKKKKKTLNFTCDWRAKIALLALFKLEVNVEIVVARSTPFNYVWKKRKRKKGMNEKREQT